MIAAEENRSGIATELGGMREVTADLLHYCQERDWAGDDPYDALNSRLYQSLPFLHFKAARLVLTQGLKRSPLNLRRLLLVPPSHNAKGLALFISALLKLGRLDFPGARLPIEELLDKLAALRSKNAKWCWGYPFDWQSRTVLLPQGFPNVICTSFVGNAWLDAHVEFGKAAYLERAVSAAEFLLETLYYEEGDSVACFSYNTLEHSKVHNANLLGAALLCRVALQSGETRFLAPALKAARYSVGHQQPDGSWAYGEREFQTWKDNFHTGFNLCALRQIARCAGTAEFDESVKRGLSFFLAHFFTSDGAPKYFHDRVYPIDIHSAAQSIITLVTFKELDPECLERALAVYRWTVSHLRAKEGWFYYQKRPFYTNRVSYMRWTQAWMLLAMAVLLEANTAEPGQ